MPLPKHVVKCVIVNGEDEVLLLKRSARDLTRPGDFDFPGGGVDDGETLEDTAVRELQEECGIRIDRGDLTLLYADTELGKNKMIIRMLFGAYVDGAEVSLSHEHESYLWAPKHDVSKLWDHKVWTKGLDGAIAHKLI